RRVFLSIIFLATSWAFAGDTIPKTAWKRAIGLPLANAGTKKPTLDAGHIDDGYWQGAPVGGFGAGTFSRTYRGDFARWHIRNGVDKYQTAYANQFAMYERTEGAEGGDAQVVADTHPEGEVRTWEWDYPLRAGDYCCVYHES